MNKKVAKIEERIEKRKQRIQKLTVDLKEEKSKLINDESTVLHLKYDEVLKSMQENGISPNEALEAFGINEESKDENVLHEGVDQDEQRY